MHNQKSRSSSTPRSSEATHEPDHLFRYEKEAVEDSSKKITVKEN